MIDLRFWSPSELAPRGALQLGQVVRVEVGEGMTLEPGPQLLDGAEVWRVAW